MNKCKISRYILLMLMLLLICSTSINALEVTLSSPIQSDGLSYIDNDFGFVVTFTPRNHNSAYLNQFSMKLDNYSQSNIRIIWDNCAYVDYNNVTSKLFHTPKKGILGNADVANKDDSMPPTLIPAGASLIEYLMSANNLKWNGFHWQPLPFFPVLKNVKGQSMAFILCFEKDSIQKTTTFQFTVK